MTVSTSITSCDFIRLGYNNRTCFNGNFVEKAELVCKHTRICQYYNPASPCLICICPNHM